MSKFRRGSPKVVVIAVTTATISRNGLKKGAKARLGHVRIEIQDLS